MHRETKVLVIGTGFSGLGMAIELKRARRARLRGAREGSRRRWHVARQHLSRLRVRRAVAHVLVLVRAEPELVADVRRRRREICDYLRHCADKYRLRPHIRFGAEVSGAQWDDEAERWQRRRREQGDTYTRAGSRRRRRRAAHPERPGDAGHRDASAASVPLGAVGPRLRPDRQARRRDRHGASAIQFVPKIAQQVASTDDLPAHAAVDHAQGRPRDQRLASRSCSAHVPWRATRSTATSLLDLRVVARWGSRSTRRSCGSHEGIALRHMKQADAGSRRCGQAHARLHHRAASACCISNDYYPALGTRHVDVVTRRASPRSRENGHRGQRRASSTRSTSSSTAPASTSPTRSTTWTSRARAGSTSRSSGASRASRPTTASPSRASPTCSSCWAPTPGSATTRSCS